MKNKFAPKFAKKFAKKFAVIALSMSLLASWTAFAQEEGGEDNFAKHKAEIVANLNKEKAAIDGEISCINSAKQSVDAKNCREKRRAVMEQLQRDRIAKQKANLQERLKNLDEKSSQIGKKNTNRP
jgi:hypothetical protein